MKSVFTIAAMLALPACGSAPEAGEAAGGESAPVNAAETPVGSRETPADRAAADPASAWIVGAWVVNGEYCEGDGGVTFHPDGTYATYEEDGVWRLEEGRLTLTTTARYEMGEAESTARVANAGPTIQQIVSHDPGSYTARFDDGTTITLDRCPNADG